jgi:hypothetical protein
MVWPKEKGCNLCHRLWHSDMGAWAIVLSNRLLDEFALSSGRPRYLRAAVLAPLCCRLLRADRVSPLGGPRPRRFVRRGA